MKIGILGGTGKEGRGLALRWASRDIEVLVGSRDPDKARRVAAELQSTLKRPLVRGATNRDVAREADTLVSTIPSTGHQAILHELRKDLEGKLLMVATVIWPPGPLERACAAEQAREVLGESTRVVAAFQTVSASSLTDVGRPLEDDVLVFGNDGEARREAQRIIARAGIRAVEAGPLQDARVIEAMTGVLIQVNKNYKVKSAGLRITGLD